ncbi:MAG: glycosyltransferase family 39 protein [Anaerolineae bacterium]
MLRAFVVGDRERSWWRLIPILLFLVAFMPRIISLGAFVNPDAGHWVVRSTKFMNALAEGILVGTYQSDHPGVFAMWGFGISMVLRHLMAGDLRSYLELANRSGFGTRLDLITTAAIFTVLVTSLSTVGVYLLARKVFGQRVALLGAILVALDPFYIAHSRVIHLDAILSACMILSTLMLIVYVTTSVGRGYLVGAGVLAGLGLLTKQFGLFMIPFAFLALGVRYLLAARSPLDVVELKRFVLDLLLWGVVVVAVYVIVWPVMWRYPGEVLRVLVRNMMEKRWKPHGWGAFFWGEIVDDPGMLFYPVVILFRLTPVSLVLFLLSIGAFIGDLRRIKEGKTMAVALGLAYILFFSWMAGLGPKKIDRYILPVFPMIDLLAAVGIARSARALGGLSWPWSAALRKTSYRIAVGVVSLTPLFWIHTFPYYMNCFNPLVGGASMAVRTLTVGLGEGYDLAAKYLNEKSDSESLRVAVFYVESFAPFFRGTTIRLMEPGALDEADYVVLYINQVQRQILPEAIHRFQDREPEHVVRIGGIEYAWVYENRERW